MKQFNLKEYLANPNRKVVTGSGRNVRIICTDSKIRDYPIIALVEEPSGFENLFSYTEGGQMISYEPSEKYDLFFAFEKHEGWVNLYKNSGGFLLPSRIYQTKEVAKKRGSWHDCYVTTTKIEWEE